MYLKLTDEVNLDAQASVADTHAHTYVHKHLHTSLYLK